MTPIKIPAKNIYSKTNQKVVDNEVNNIEITINDYFITEEEGLVYNDALSLSNIYEEKSVQDINSNRTTYGGGGYTGHAYAFAGVKLTPTYITQTIHIPVEKGNEKIAGLLVGTDFDGESNIKCSISGIKREGDVIVPIIGGADGDGVKDKDGKNVSVAVDLDDVSFLEPTNEGNANYSFDSIIAVSEISGNAQTMSSAKVNYVNKTNLADLDYEISNGEFILTVTILCGLEIIKVSGNYTQDSYNPTVPTTANGTYEEYIPKAVELEVYGITIRLDSQNKTIQINEEKKNLISFNSNELFQVNNAPSIEESYAKVITQYINGKECATIRCSISDYYEIDKDGETSANKAISKSGENGLPMTLSIGDIVIPYVYSANRQDKPMSLNKDGSAKSFQVLGKKMIYDGAVWQELTLQEYIEIEDYDITDIAVIKVDSVFFRNDGREFCLSIKLLEGELDIGDVIEYNGERATVIPPYITFMPDFYGLGDIEWNGQFHSALRETIIVKKIK